MENPSEASGQSSIPAPPAQPVTPPPPPPPAPYGSRQEWRAWRHQQREYYRAHHGWGWFGMWGWFWAFALILVGVYYLMVNLGLMTWVRGDLIWPILLIVLGVLVLVGRTRPWLS